MKCGIASYRGVEKGNLETMEQDKEKKLEIFFSGLSATLNSVWEIQKVYNPIMAFEFNPFKRFWWLDENKVSDIIAFFLNPEESHSQGNIFLKLFLEKFKLEKPSQKVYSGTTIKVKPNYRTEEGRWIDIVVEFGENEFLIGIENKIYDNTLDQNKQVSDYCRYLINKTNGNSILFYLAPEGKNPSESSITKEERKEHEKNDHFKIISYQRDIIDLVYQWYIHCQAERVRVFIMEFYQHLKHKYMGETFMNENNIIAEYIKEKNHVEIALQIFNSWPQVKLLLIEQFKKQIKEIPDEMKEKIDRYSIDEETVFGEHGTGFYFYPKGWKMYCIGFGFETNYFHDFYFGIYNKSSNISLEEIKKRSNQLSMMMKEEPNDIWPRSEYFETPYRDWDDNSPIWKDISDNKTMKDNIKTKIKSILSTLQGQEL